MEEYDEPSYVVPTLKEEGDDYTRPDDVADREEHDEAGYVVPNVVLHRRRSLPQPNVSHSTNHVIGNAMRKQATQKGTYCTLGFKPHYAKMPFALSVIVNKYCRIRV